MSQLKNINTYKSKLLLGRYLEYDKSKKISDDDFIYKNYNDKNDNSYYIDLEKEDEKYPLNKYLNKNIELYICFDSDTGKITYDIYYKGDKNNK